MQQQIIITLTDKGEVSVSGPLENKLVCYGLLEMAKDIVDDYAKAHQKPVLSASAGDLEKFTGGRK